MEEVQNSLNENVQAVTENEREIHRKLLVIEELKSKLG